MTVRTDVKLSGALFFILCAVLVFWYLQSQGLCIISDDAFISYRYAKNIAAGNGPVFNSGERVWGYTSPAQTWLLAGLAWAGADIQDTGTLSSLLMVAVSAWMVFLLLSRFVHPVYAFLVAVHHMFNATGIYEFLGLETSLLICSQLVFLYLVLECRYRLACCMAALVCFARPDALVFVVPVLLLVPGCRQLKNVQYFLIPGIVWLLFAYYYYGDIFPHTLYAKKQVVSFAQYLRINLPEVFSYKNPFAEGFGRVGFTILCVCLNLCLMVRMRVRRSAPLVFAFCFFPWVLVVCYAVIGAPPLHFWQVYSAKFFFWLGLVAGLGILAESAGAHLSKKRLVRRPAFVGGALLGAYFLFFVAPALPQLLSYVHAQDGAFWGGARYKTYTGIATWCNSNVPPRSTVLVHEIGAIGFHTDMTIIDGNGLVTDITVEDRKMTDLEMLQHYKPDYILFPGQKRAFAVEPSGSETGAALQYAPVAYFPRTTSFYDFTLLGSGPF